MSFPQRAETKKPAVLQTRSQQTLYTRTNSQHVDEPPSVMAWLLAITKSVGRTRICKKSIYLAKLNVSEDKHKGKAKKHRRRGCSPRSGPLRGERDQDSSPGLLIFRQPSGVLNQGVRCPQSGRLKQRRNIKGPCTPQETTRQGSSQ